MVVLPGAVVVVELGGAVVVVVVLGPWDTTTSTGVFGATLLLGGGLVEITSPFGTVGELW